ncbi:carbohydrate ABC transporter permease [Actinacidiphila yeochonensis]|uniref:carbohydrate ABC transporter permease n=1 Tax=Actinacidiphila yeochonensis TaxID=89050 RepID=UPI000A599D08|nr:hypothetical protein [Actinacidiphila yeochonensis]
MVDLETRATGERQRPRAAADRTPAGADEPRSPRVRGRSWRLLLLLAGALAFLFPFYYMVVGSLQTHTDSGLSGVLPHPGNLTFANYRNINQAIDLGRSLLNSGIFTGGVILGTLVFGSMAGYALAQLQFRGKNLLFNTMLLVQIVPFQLLTIPLYVLIARDYGLSDSYLA